MSPRLAILRVFKMTSAKGSSMKLSTCARGVLSLILLGMGSAAHAATFLVTHTGDPADGATTCTRAVCSLRGAISAANASPGHDTVSLPTGTYLLSRTGRGENDNRMGDLDVHDALTIERRPAATVVIGWAQPGADRLLQFHPSAPDVRLTLVGLTLRDGDSSTTPGGAILSDGALQLRDVTFIDNSSQAYGAAIAMQSVPAGSLPSLDMRDVHFENNIGGTGNGGAIDITTTCGAIHIERAQFIGNSGRNGSALWLGGCLQTPSPVLIRASTFTLNVGDATGALRVQPGNVVHIEDSVFEGNRTGSGSAAGGAIMNAGARMEIRNTVFIDNRSVDIGGASLGMGGAISGTAPALIEGSLFDGNAAGENGGALHFNSRLAPFTIRTTRFFDNRTESFGADQQSAGGAIFIGYDTTPADAAADLIIDSHFEDNRAPGLGDDDGGGAIHKRGSTPLRIERSGFVANQGGPGGGIRAYRCGASAALPPLAVINSTFSANAASAAGQKRGGAIAASGCAVALESVTLVGNLADDGSALYAQADITPASYAMKNTLISGACRLLAGTTLTDGGGNIESPADTCVLSQASSQPLLPANVLHLGPLRNAATAYYLPGRDSAMIDAGLPLAACAAVDQRGLARDGVRCDVGATEPSNPFLFRDGFDDTGP